MSDEQTKEEPTKGKWAERTSYFRYARKWAGKQKIKKPRETVGNIVDSKLVRNAFELVKDIKYARAHRSAIEDHEQQIAKQQPNLFPLISEIRSLKKKFNPLMTVIEGAGALINGVALAGVISAGVYVGTGNDPMDIPDNVTKWGLKHQLITQYDLWLLEGGDYSEFIGHQIEEHWSMEGRKQPSKEELDFRAPTAE